MNTWLAVKILFSASELPSHTKHACCAIVRALKIAQLWGTMTRAAHTLKDESFLWAPIPLQPFRDVMFYLISEVPK